MNFTNLLLSFLLGALIVGGVTWLALRGGEPEVVAGRASATGEAVTDPASEATAPDAPDAVDRFFGLTAENRDLEKDVKRLQARLVELNPPPFDPAAFRFGLPEKADAFDQAKWPELSGHMTALGKVLAPLRESLAAGRQPSGKELADIVKHNTPLEEFAVRFGGDLDDSTPNNSYTHPAVVANLVRASLMGASDPLTRDQELAIEVLGDAWVGETARSLSALPPGAPDLAKTVAQVDAKLRFLASLKGVLTESQKGILFHPDTEGRLKLDLLSPALVYVLAVPVEATDREDMETKLVTQLLETAGVEVEDVSKLDWVGRQWVDEIPGVLTPMTSRDPDLIFPHVSVVQARARAEAAAIERILAMGGYSDDDVERLKGVGMLLYPFVLEKTE